MHIVVVAATATAVVVSAPRDHWPYVNVPPLEDPMNILECNMHDMIHALNY